MRVSAGNPFRHSDSAVKLSVLAERLEKPFQLFICRHWHCDSKNFIEERISFADLVRRGNFSLARVDSLGIFLSWTHPSLSFCVLSTGDELSLFLGVESLVGSDFHADKLCWSSFIGCVDYCWSFPLLLQGCVLCKGLCGGKGRSCCWSILQLLAVP